MFYNNTIGERVYVQKNLERETHKSVENSFRKFEHVFV